MDFDSPEVMKDFPGLYSSEKRKGNESDYNEDNEKATKKEMIIGKRKEKKEKKDKDKGYAALEGESSDEASPCKAKKSKTFKFSKSKDKEKDKEKEHSRDKGECSSKTRPKKKAKLQKFPRGFGNKCNAYGATQDLADALPIFGSDLHAAVQRGKCHDGIALPLPVRECIDYLEVFGLHFENIYKISGPKNKLHLIRKLYNSRQTVKLTDYDVPTATSVLKTFLRDLPEPIFTADLLPRFEEAGAILNYNTRGKHLFSLLNSLPNENLNLITWLIIHWHNVAQKEQVNKMSMQNLAQALNHTLHISSRLLQALITHRIDFFPHFNLLKYLPPLEAGSPYPDDPNTIMMELRKLESALNLIHWEMQQGYISEERQDQLWEVQRVQTELKRKVKKSLNKPYQIVVSEEVEENEEQTMDSQVAEEEEGTVEEEESVQIEEPNIRRQYDQPQRATAKQYVTEMEAVPEPEPIVIIDSDTDSDEAEEVPQVSQQGLVCAEHSGNWEASRPGYQTISTDGAGWIIPDSQDPSTAYQREPDFVYPGNIVVSGPRYQTVPGPANQIYSQNYPGQLQPQFAEFREPQHYNSDEEGAFANINREEFHQESNTTERNYQSDSEENEIDNEFIKHCVLLDHKLRDLQAKNNLLTDVIKSLAENISEEKGEIELYKQRLENMKIHYYKMAKLPRNYKEVRDLLIHENHMLEIKKVELARQIMEHREQIVGLGALMIPPISKNYH